MRVGVDIDGVLTLDVVGWDYENRKPNLAMIAWVNQKFEEGHYIELFSARLKSDKKVTKEWLKKHGVKYNNLILGKPRYEMYIDDIAQRPEEVCDGRMNRTYNYHQSCWRYIHGHVFADENHPCYFCGYKLSMKDVDKMECKVCGIMKCPKCGNCLCTITDLQYSTLIRIHEKYCCHLNEYKGKIELEEPYDHKLVKNYLTTIQTCFDAERKKGNI